MGLASLIDVADAVAAKITASWEPVTPDGAEMVFVPVNPDVTAVEGRRVFVFPMSAEQVGIASRGEDLNEYTVGVLVVENYRGAGPPPTEWTKLRLQFGLELADMLGEVREPDGPLFPAPLDDLISETVRVVSAFDPTALREAKTFWMLFEASFRRDDG